MPQISPRTDFPTPDKVDRNVEGVVDLERELTLDMPDSELIALAEKWTSDASFAQKELKNVWQTNEDYWLGKQVDPLKLQTEQSAVVDNRIWLSIETIIPAVTSQIPEPTAYPPDETDQAVATAAAKLEKILAASFEEQDMQGIFEDTLRLQFIHRIAFLKFNFDVKHRKIITSIVRPQRMLFPKTGRSVDEVPFLGEYMEDTAKNLIDLFPKKKKEIRKMSGADKKGEAMLGTRLGYIEFWTNDFVFWKLGDFILDKKRNIHYDFEGKDEIRVDDFGMQSAEKRFRNHFNSPKKPYVVINIYSLAKQLWDDTSMTEQARPLQDVTNKRKRQIDNNASDASGVWIGDSERITPEQFAQIQTHAGARNHVPGGSASLSRETGRPLPQFVENDMHDSRSEIDNIFGTHTVLRGEKVGGREAAAARLILKQSDEGRLGIFARALERAATEAYNWWAQLIKIYGIEEMAVGVQEGENKTQLKFDSSAIPDGVVIRVKAGSLLPKDKDSIRRDAQDLWSRGALDPLTLYERMGFPNPQETARRLFHWRTSPVQYANDYLSVPAPPPQPNQPERKAPSLSVRFEDLTPLEQAQALDQVGIQSDTELREQLFVRGILRPPQTSTQPDFAGSKNF